MINLPNELNNTETFEYFNVKVTNKAYPSCYQYNVLIMLAKRLLQEEHKTEESNVCKNKYWLNKSNY